LLLTKEEGNGQITGPQRRTLSIADRKEGGIIFAWRIRNLHRECQKNRLSQVEGKKDRTPDVRN